MLPIILLDADPPSLREDVPGRYGRCRALTKLVSVLERSAGQSFGLEARDFEGLDADAQTSKLLRSMRATKLVKKTVPISVVRNVVRVFSANLNTVYVPETPLATEVYLVQTDDVDPNDEEAIPPEEVVRRWRAVAPNLAVLRGPGNHMTMLEHPQIDFVAGLATRIWRLCG